MNFLEALKSGKPFKRINEKQWRNWTNGVHLMSKEMYLAEDWEIQELKITISKSQLLDALNTASPHTTYYDHGLKMDTVYRDISLYTLLNKLGF